jgi:hypothetical protein
MGLKGGNSMKQFQIGDKVVAPDGQLGTVRQANHEWGEYDVLLEDGRCIWFYQEELVEAGEGDDGTNKS